MLTLLSSRVRSALFLLVLVMPNTLMSSEAVNPQPDLLKKCLYVSSYHKGYAWSDAIENSIRENLTGKCELRQIDMDTKRNKSPEHIFGVLNHIIKTINDWQPDIVITSDDNAAKHLITPHYKDDKIPFVFCGINWTVDEYGFPFSNVTGIVEVAPVKTMLEEAFDLSGQGRKALYIGASTLSEKKNFERIKIDANHLNIEIEAIHTSHFSQWKNALKKSSEYDFVVMGSNAGIDGWDEIQAIETALELSTKISVTNHEWMMPYSAFGFTKVASEQGDWAAKVALRILNGTSPGEVPLASNKKWDLWVNESLLESIGVRPSRGLMRKAKKMHPTL